MHKMMDFAKFAKFNILSSSAKFNIFSQYNISSGAKFNI